MQTEMTKGEQTRLRILQTAAELFHRQGVNATCVDAILAASQTGKGQFYRYFKNKHALVRETLQLHYQWIQDDLSESMAQLDTLAGFETWLDQIVARVTRNGCEKGCPLGSMAAELSEIDTVIRQDIERLFAQIQHKIARGIAAMQARGEFDLDVAPTAFAEFVWATIQGGILLAQNAQDIRPLHRVLDHLKADLQLRSRHADTPDWEALSQRSA